MRFSGYKVSGKGCEHIHQNDIFLHSGVSEQEKAKQGVGMIVEPSTAGKILETISERTIIIKIKKRNRSQLMFKHFLPAMHQTRRKNLKSFFTTSMTHYTT